MLAMSACIMVGNLREVEGWQMRGFQESMSGRLALSLEVRAERDLSFQAGLYSAWSSIHTMGASVLYRPAQLLLHIAPAAQSLSSSGTVTQASRCLCSPKKRATEQCLWRVLTTPGGQAH